MSRPKAGIAFRNDQFHLLAIAPAVKFADLNDLQKRRVLIAYREAWMSANHAERVNERRIALRALVNRERYMTDPDSIVTARTTSSEHYWGAA